MPAGARWLMRTAGVLPTVPRMLSNLCFIGAPFRYVLLGWGARCSFVKAKESAASQNKKRTSAAKAALRTGTFGTHSASLRAGSEAVPLSNTDFSAALLRRALSKQGIPCVAAQGIPRELLYCFFLSRISGLKVPGGRSTSYSTLV